jgi:enoyl-CoA hydratase/carnithine racemase
MPDPAPRAPTVHVYFDERPEGRIAVVAPDALDAAVEARLAAILACAPVAVRLQKQLIRAWEDLPLSAAVAAGIETFAAAYRSGEPAAAMAAWLSAREARRAAASASTIR